jgi:hypothetical protein
MLMKNSGDTNGNRTRDFPACSTVPKPTAPPLTPLFNVGIHETSLRNFHPMLRKGPEERSSRIKPCLQFN